MVYPLNIQTELKEIKDPVIRLKKLYELSMTVAGDPIEVFKRVANMIGEVFDVRVVCLSEIRGEELFFISVYVDGEVSVDVGHCPLAITPCATVEKEKDLRMYDEVIEKFPQASFLKTHNAYSYCGFPTLGSDGEVIAVTCLLDDKPHDFTAEDQDLLRIFGQRIGMEIERKRHLDAQKEAQQKIEHLAFYDSLTGLPNRSLLLDRLQQTLNQAERHDFLCAVLFLDLDRFKSINDSLGHSVGDSLLKVVASRIEGSVRVEDTVARLGGDEFVVVLTNLGDDMAHAAENAQMIAENILSAFSEPCLCHDHEIHISPSIGIVIFPEGISNVEDILKRADTAMYRAKAAASEPIQFFEQQMQDAVLERLSLEKFLRYAIDKNEMHTYFQPIASFADKKIMGAEVLLRWQHPEQGMVSPIKFIPVAEDTGQIISIGNWVFNQAISQLDTWKKDHANCQDLYIAVNVSARQFRQADFVDSVLSHFEKYSVNPKDITIEITESIVMADIDDAIAKMNQLKEHGIYFAIDDFGTGYSSLAYLKRLPIDILKIDRSFVKDVVENKDSQAIVDSILSMANNLGLKTVAEGIETEAQYEYFKNRGANYFQGYLLSRPIPPEEFKKVCI